MFLKVTSIVTFPLKFAIVIQFLVKQKLQQV
jgi:hypothetical protein